MNKKSNSIISFIAIILGFFMALLDTTIVNITLPKMTQYFNVSMEHISWVINGYNLAFAVLIITAARLADQFGRKKLFIIGVFMFTLCSFLSGISSTPEQLIAFRVLQGLSAAFVVPITMPLAIEIFPPDKRGLIVGLWGAFAGLAAASGPSLGGIITQFLNWRYIFFINIPIGIVCIFLTLKYIKESYDSSADKSIDWAGILTLSITMFSLTFALIKANDKGWTSSYILTLFGVAAISLILFIIIEMRIKSPMLPLSLFKILPFTCGAITLFLLGLGMMSGSFFLAFFLIQIKGMSQLTAGLIISTMSIASMFFSGIAGAFINKVGGRWFSALGMTLMAIACFLYSTLSKDSSYIGIILRLIVSGAGMGLAMPSLMSSTINNVPLNKVGITSGVNNMTRTLGTVLGVALFVTIFTTSITTQMTKAKSTAARIITADKVFNDKAKSEILASLKSNTGQTPSLNTLIKQIDTKEQELLKTTPLRAQAMVKVGFNSQKNETKKVWTLLQAVFTNHSVKAFSTTFRIGFFILLPGILFALFSDKRKFS